MRENLLKYPESCMLWKNVPKTSFYRHLEVSTSMKKRFQNDVESISWLYKIAPTTLQVQATESMREIEVFLVELKNDTCGTELFQYIDRFMPQYIVFLLHYETQYRFLINYKEWADEAHTRFTITQSFESGWLTTAQLSLPMQGSELPDIYENFVRYIASDQLSKDDNLKEAVLSYQEQQVLQKRLAALQAQIAKESQPKRKFELHQQIISLKEKLS